MYCNAELCRQICSNKVYDDNDDELKIRNDKSIPHSISFVPEMTNYVSGETLNLTDPFYFVCNNNFKGINRKT